MKLISKRRLVYLQGMQSYITKFINNNYQVCRILYRVINSGVGLPQLFSLPCSPLLWQRPWKPRGQWCSGAVKVPEDLLASLAGLGGLWLLPSEIYQNKKGGLVQGLLWLFLRRKEHFLELPSRRGVPESGCHCYWGAEWPAASPHTFPRGKWGLAVVNTPGSLQGSFFPSSKIKGCVCLFALWLGSRPAPGIRWAEHQGGQKASAWTNFLCCSAAVLEILSWELKKNYTIFYFPVMLF